MDEVREELIFGEKPIRLVMAAKASNTVTFMDAMDDIDEIREEKGPQR